MTTPAVSQLGLPEIVGAAWNAIAEEMGRTLVRTAVSANVKERRDCSAAIFTMDGDLLAQAAHIPIHISSLFGFPEFIRSQQDLRPGDVFASNDPYAGMGSHLNDIAVAAPVFVDGEAVAVVATIAHHPDVGGATPGSESPDSVSIFQEGLRIPPVRLMAEGKQVEDIWRLITHNSRLTRVVDADMQAQVAAVKTGVGRTTELVMRYGRHRLSEASAEWLDYAERRFRAGCTRLGGLRFTIEGELDDDGLGGQGVCVRGFGLISGDEALIDLTGSDRQAAGGVNAPLSATKASVYYALKSIVDPGCPNNQGYFRAIHLETRPGTVVDPLPPAAVGHRGALCQKLANSILRGVAEASSEHGAAESHGLSLVVLSGTGPDGPFVNYEGLAGGHGGGPHGPGLTVSMAHTTNSSNLPIEVMEHEYPLRVRRFQVRSGSAGAGINAGGNGMVREYEIIADNIELTLSLTDSRVPPRGARGGQAGAPAIATVVTHAGARQLPAHKGHIRIPSGSRLVIETAGGGGWGPPE